MVFADLRACRILCLLGALLGAARAQADFTETPEFAEVVNCTEAYVAKFGAGKVLLVLDIDNTLLAADTELGSDQWFLWQEYLLDHEPTSPQRVADDFNGLLAAQGLLFTLGTMHPPQPDLPELIREIQDLGAATLVLTSRGDEFRRATERELTANGYDFTKSTLVTAEPLEGSFLPYDLDDLPASGLTTAEAQSIRLKEPKPATYRNGIFMTSGQHKGAMLACLLHRARDKYSAVVYVDDHNHHVVRVLEAMLRRKLAVTGFHYQREDTRVQAFRYGEKQTVTRQWRQLDHTLKRIFEVPTPQKTPVEAAP